MEHEDQADQPTEAEARLDRAIEAGLRLLTRDEILAATDRQMELVEVPEWGGAVYIRSLTADERDEFEESLLEQNKRTKKQDVRLRQARAKLVSRAACDDKGVRLFSERDVVALGAKNAAAMDRLFDKASELSGIREADLEELVEDFTDTPDAPSSGP